ncbi:13515_t:CDS:2, partial [Dentiscutata heterogama]
MSTHSNNTKYAKNEESDFVSTVYNYDWSSTSLGPMELWDTSLKNAVNLCLQSVFPTVIYIGPTYISLYNQAYRPMLKTRHPYALGKTFKDVWPELYEVVVDSLFERVRTTGKGIYNNDQLFELQRDGYIEEA